jgi:hypothetical protein
VLAHGHYLNLKNHLHLKSASARLIAALVLFLAVGARAETTNTLSDAEIQGRKLAQKILEQWPSANLTNTGILKIRNKEGKSSETAIRFETIVKPFAFWTEGFEATTGTNQITLGIVNLFGGDVRYALYKGPSTTVKTNVPLELFGKQTMIPFAGSDFWVADLGLEFFHWPAQKILPKTTNLKRGREYTLLESTNPNPTTNGYSRVLSWIDKESGGILEAEAYDAQGKLLKEFEPKSFKKINGQWELSEMEIRNVQTDSRTRLEFDLKSN